MKTLRLALGAALTLVIVGGYAVSQWIYLKGPDAVADFDVKVNQLPVHLLMLVLFAGAVGLAFIPDREEPIQ